VLEGMTVHPSPAVAGAPVGPTVRAYIQGPSAGLRFDDSLLSKHVLFLGGIGTGKTNAMMQLVEALRGNASMDDVFVIFDTKGDFREALVRPGDAVISNEPGPAGPDVVWNLFADVGLADAMRRSDDVLEIATTVFSEDLERAAQNFYFVAGARDVFAAVVDAMARESASYSNADLRARLDIPTSELADLLSSHADLAGASRYLAGSGSAPNSVRAFLQQAVSAAFSGAFAAPGTFSVRRFVHERAARALFVEYDISVGARLLPVYRVLLDMAIKEALGSGRTHARGNVFFIFDEFALLPHLSHVSDGINFGRSLGLKFIVGTQNVDQVMHAYGPELGRTILSGFGTVFAFRLMDEASRTLVRTRFGRNRKQVTTELAVRAQGVRQDVVEGNVVEDWVLSALTLGQCIVALPEGAPFSFQFGPRDGGAR
jgi:type IV secretory pathway TraG/TraD family ATPase VirD4